MFVSEHADIMVPHQNLIEFVLERDVGSDLLDKPLFIDPADIAKHYSLSTLTSTAQKLGLGLRKRFAIEKGDVTAIFSANSIQYPVAVFGSFYAGCTVTLVNPIYRKDEMASQLETSGATLIITTSELLQVASEAATLVGIDPHHIILTDALATESNTLLEDVINRGSGEAFITNSLVLCAEDIAFLCFSSGTTGLSKGVRLSHRNIIANLLQWDAAETRLNEQDSIISVLPFSHIYALSVLIMNPIRRSMSSYVLPRFQPLEFLKFVETFQITASFIVPPIVKLLLSDQAEKFNLSSLKFLCSGAAPLAPEMACALCRRYRIPIDQGFGLTETSPVLCYGSFEGDTYSGSVGRLLPSVELRIVDEQGCTQPTNGHGELQVRGPNVMSGYLNNDEANANAFTTDGFFKTGDLGYIDPDGLVFIVDRLKELIKYKGFQVAPAELESLLLTHPAIQDCAVVGRTCDVEVTELPTAYCVLRPEALQDAKPLPRGWTEIDADQNESQTKKVTLARDIMSFVAQNLANYKKLRGGVIFTDSIPRVAAGKILRRVLRERVAVDFIL